jgi:hypothetical protein
VTFPPTSAFQQPAHSTPSCPLKSAPVLCAQSPLSTPTLLPHYALWSPHWSFICHLYVGPLRQKVPLYT